MPRKIYVVIPTYNEAGGIEKLVRAVDRELSRTGDEHRILVVDDNSPDGTGLVLDRLREELPVLEVFHRPAKAGLARAYLAGFDVALSRGADAIVQMDADFSHDPAYVPLLLAELETNDMVLGSRYVTGGGVADWDLLRRTLSRGGCLYARLVLGLPVRDLTGGFKAHRRGMLEAIEFETVASEGYAFQIEITYRALRRGFRVREIPITFTERTEGTSKMSSGIALEAARVVPRLRWDAWRRGPRVPRRGRS